MAQATTRSWRFTVDLERDDDGYYFTIDGGEPRGPFGDDLEREHDLLRAIRAWKARAEGLGGHVVRTSRTTFIVTLPEGHDCDGGEPLFGARPGVGMGRHWSSPQAA